MHSEEKIKTAEEAIRSRLKEIGAALDDLKHTATGVSTASDITDNLKARYQNRLMSVFISISHMRDGVRRLAKRRGVDWNDIKQQIDSSVPIQLCIRLSETHKHGLGGKSRNATILNGFITVIGLPKKGGNPANPPPDAVAMMEGMQLVDSEYGQSHSSVVIKEAMRSWVTLIRDYLGLDETQWYQMRFPNPRGVIHAPAGTHVTVPLGTTLVFDVPDNATFVKDVKRRADKA